MEKIKAFIIKYKWWISGGALALAAIYLLRNVGGSDSGGSGIIQTAYTTSDGSIANQYTDPSLMLAQLDAQTNLSLKQTDAQTQLGLANIQKDISFATLETNKWLGQIDSNTQTALGNINANMNIHIADQQTAQAQIGAGVQYAQIDAQKYIAKYQAQTARRGQEYGAIQGLLNWGGGFFK